MTAEGANRELLIEVRTDVKHLSRKIDVVLDRLEKGDERLREHDLAITTVRARADANSKEIDEHKNAHWKTYGLAIGLSSLAVAIIVAVGKLLGG